MFIYILCEVFLFTLLVYYIFYFVSFKGMMELESVSSYECGFDLISKTRVSFSYRFFLISILFLIFDVEIALMLPAPYLSIGQGGAFLVFLMILVVGLLFEYYAGVLDWL